MIKLNGNAIEMNKFPDGTPLLNFQLQHEVYEKGAVIEWFYENEEEFIVLIYLTKHLRENGVGDVFLKMPYVPNARQDRVNSSKDVFTLKYFADIINYLDFNAVQVLDPHSYVTEGLFNRVISCSPANYIESVIKELNDGLKVENDKIPIHIFYPDEGAMKRYSSSLLYNNYSFGIKRRNIETGGIEKLDIFGETNQIKDNIVLIIDDICSSGETIFHSATKLKELGAKDIYVWVTHCENTILKGKLLIDDLITKIYTTNSVFTKKHKKITVIEL